MPSPDLDILQQLGAAIGYMPELPLVIGAMVLLMIGVFMRSEQKAGEVVSWLAILLLTGSALLLFTHPDGAVTYLFGKGFVIDDFTQFMKLLVIIGAAVALYMSIDFFREANLLKFEYPVLAVLATAGMMMMISANDLIALYLGLELQSLALYVMAAFRRDSARSSEAGLKYFVLGALSSGLLLYGCSLIYGFTGSTNFAEIAAVAAKGAQVGVDLETTGHNLGLIFGLVMLLAGVAFKVSAVPFHMWTPDVYEGAPTPVTAFFAAAPKIAAMAMFLRVVLGAFPAMQWEWQQIIVAISVGSMLLGAFAALGQTNIKRLMAYSSISHMGFALVGLAAGTPEGARGVIIYLAIYLVMSLGIFACILAMRRNENNLEDIQELAGLARNDPTLAFLLAMLLFSLAGIPPLAGFFAKFYVFMAAIKAEFYILAIIGVLASVVGAVYYLRLVKIMYFDEPVDEFAPMTSNLKVVLGVSGLFVLFYVFYPAPLVNAAEAAAGVFFTTAAG